MRRSHLANLSIASLTLVVSGCHQTAGGVSQSPLTPISPLAPHNSLMPVPGSSISPMGSPTRVPPPSTGSVGIPNNYLGGAPSGQVHNGSNMPMQNMASMNDPSAVIGSGVQPVGWTETAASLATTGGAPAPGSFAAPAAPPRPQLGGMQVIDLTQAPPPPGYRPSGVPMMANAAGQMPTAGYNTYPTANIGYGVPGSYAGASITANGTFAAPSGAPASMSPTYRTVEPTIPPAAISPGATSYGPLLAVEPQAVEFQPAPAVASAPQVVREMPSTDAAPRTAQAPADSDPSLQWRRPNARF